MARYRNIRIVTRPSEIAIPCGLFWYERSCKKEGFRNGKGKVKWFDNKKGYGFILPEEKRCFRALLGDPAGWFKTLNEDKALVWLVNTEKGEQAKTS